MNGTPQRVLLIGYGNPGRMDDGLGPALAEAMGLRGVPGLDVDADYQLVPEDAHAVAEHDVTVFADASLAGPEPFEFRKVNPVAGGGALGSHALEPDTVAGLARALFREDVSAYVLGIRGYRFNEFGEGLSEPARRNLSAAADFMERVIRSGAFEDAATQSRETQS